MSEIKKKLILLVNKTTLYYANCVTLKHWLLDKDIDEQDMLVKFNIKQVCIYNKKEHEFDDFKKNYGKIQVLSETECQIPNYRIYVKRKRYCFDSREIEPVYELTSKINKKQMKVDIKIIFLISH